MGRPILSPKGVIYSVSLPELVNIDTFMHGEVLSSKYVTEAYLRANETLEEILEYFLKDHGSAGNIKRPIRKNMNHRLLKEMTENTSK